MTTILKKKKGKRGDAKGRKGRCGGKAMWQGKPKSPQEVLSFPWQPSRPQSPFNGRAHVNGFTTGIKAGSVPLWTNVIVNREGVKASDTFSEGECSFSFLLWWPSGGWEFTFASTGVCCAHFLLEGHAFLLLPHLRGQTYVNSTCIR